MRAVVLFAATLLAAQVVAQEPEATLNQLADRFVAQQVQYDPTLAYFTGVPTKDHSRFADRTPKALDAFDATERADLKQLEEIDPAALSGPARATYANLKEQLEDDLGVRVCRPELWNVNHFDGWQSAFAEIATHQPVTTADDRAQALARWASVGRYLDVEIANLRRGLDQGYSAPQSVVRRVIAQMDGLATSDPTKSPFYSPAERSHDTAFEAQFRLLITSRINPALHRYQAFLKTDYLPKAREGIAISDLPNGAACYQAYLRANTTLPRTPQQVFDLGQQTVNANLAEVKRLGEKDYGSSDVPTIVAAIKAKPAEHFRSKEELLAFSQQFLPRAREKTASTSSTPSPPRTSSSVPRPHLKKRPASTRTSSRSPTPPNPPPTSSSSASGPPKPAPRPRSSPRTRPGPDIIFRRPSHASSRSPPCSRSSSTTRPTAKAGPATPRP